MIYFEKDHNFDDITKKGLVVIDFFATWCGPCKMLLPIVDEVSKEMTDIPFYAIDIDKYRNEAIDKGIRSVPTLIIYKDGKEVARQMGFQPKDRLIKWIESFK